MSEDEPDAPHDSRETDELMFDHENGRRMNRFASFTVNNEHRIFGYTRSSDIGEVKAMAKINILLAGLACGELTEQDALDIQGAMWTTDGMIDRSRDGFERKLGQTEYGVQWIKGPAQPKGFLNKVGGIFKGKKDEDVQEGPYPR
jgi:hypothetical protein